MQLENPREYLPLVKSEDNFSEIYGLRYETLYPVCALLGPIDIELWNHVLDRRLRRQWTH
jgi:hypothetical protein